MLASRLTGRAVWLASFGGMGLGMSLQQLPETDMGVDLRGVELGMPQDGLDVANVRSGLVHERGHGVTVDVAGAGFINASRFDIAATVFGQRVGLNGFAVDSQEQRPLLGIDCQCIAGLLDVTGDPRQSPSADRYIAVLLSFATLDQQRLAVDVNVI